ncbi:MAG: hypothetical protein DMG41_01395 [Acidobacteria bacterium]|nr:MAG: hypothetical protein DMG42_14525 [Acidobacteriota bacterium]PYT91751.1 MAG: hypothetical protein DMG41_01395 [Acidobacteriota bacterium]
MTHRRPSQGAAARLGINRTTLLYRMMKFWYQSETFRLI